MFPPIFQTLNVADIRAFVGSQPVRIFDFGFAPDGTVYPYITFQQVSGQPFEQISGLPCADRDVVQVDCWAKNRTEVRQLARIVQNVFEAAGQGCRLIGQGYEVDTQVYRVAFEVDWLVSR